MLGYDKYEILDALQNIYIYIYIHELRLPFYKGSLTNATEIVKSDANCYMYAFFLSFILLFKERI